MNNTAKKCDISLAGGKATPIHSILLSLCLWKYPFPRYFFSLFGTLTNISLGLFHDPTPQHWLSYTLALFPLPYPIFHNISQIHLSPDHALPNTILYRFHKNEWQFFIMEQKKGMYSEYGCHVPTLSRPPPLPTGIACKHSRSQQQNLKKKTHPATSDGMMSLPGKVK
ncbi:UNVERIFIED_CONTAM: hypothetical protein K2H54_050873 [Gekko kuhli]